MSKITIRILLLLVIKYIAGNKEVCVMFITFCCDIYHKDQKVGRLEIINGKLIKNEVYTDNIMLHPFPRSTTFIDITSALEDRVICKSRCTPEIMEDIGISEYNIYDILKNTHGVDVNDFIWFKFDDDDARLSWNDLNPRIKG